MISRRKKQSDAFTSPQLGSDLKIIAGKGEAVETFYCDLYTLAQQSEYVATRFKQKPINMKEDNYEIVLQDYESKYVYTFLCIHYYRQVGDRLGDERLLDWLPRVLAVASYFMHAEVIDFLMMENIEELSIKDAYALIDEFHLEELCGSAVEDWRADLLTNVDMRELTSYLKSVRKTDAHVFETFCLRIMQNITTKLSAAHFGEVLGRKFIKMFDTIFETEFADELTLDMRREYDIDADARCVTCNDTFESSEFMFRSWGEDKPTQDQCPSCFVISRL
jgi:hypothetical protein